MSFSSALWADETDDSELLGAFANLVESMGSSDTEVIDPKNVAVDQALDKAFDPMLTTLKNSSGISLDQVDGPDTANAIKKLSGVPLDGFLRTEYTQMGTAVSLLLWQGSQQALHLLLINILKQLYADDDPRNFRFTLDASPVPFLEAQAVDLNFERRAEEKQRAEFASRFQIYENKIKPRDAPPRWGMEIRISAGMFATLKTVDELAAQIAKALAMHNPTVYGFQEDRRFTQNQKYIEMINQLIDGGSDEARLTATIKKQEMLADFAAMERLNAAGFSPWALFNYEERHFTWIADVFLRSKNHILARTLLKSNIYKLKDWSRPLRLQLQGYYMHHLQGIDRGKGMHLDETEFSPQLKRIRLRLFLYTKPFFLGLWYQVVPTSIISGGIIIPYLFPNVAQSALEAFNFSADGPLASWFSQTINQSKDTVGGLISKGSQATQDILNSSYLNFTGAKKNISEFFSSYRYALSGGAALITATLLRRYAEPLKNGLLAWKERRSLRFQSHQLPPARADEANEANIDIEVDDSIIDSYSRPTALTRFKSSAVTAWYLSAHVVKNSSVALKDFALRGWRASQRISSNAIRATNKKSAQAWHNLVRLTQATPGALLGAASTSSQFALRVGAGSCKRGLALCHFTFIDVPQDLVRGSIKVVAELKKAGNEYVVWRTKQKIKSQREKVERAATKKILQAAAINKELERQKTLTNALKERNFSLENPNATLEDLRMLIDRYRKLSNDKYAPEHESLGFTTKWAARNRYRLLMAAYARWVALAQTLAPDKLDIELFSMIETMNQVHLEKYSALSGKEYSQIATEFYRLIENIPSPEVKRMIRSLKTSATNERPFLTFLFIQSKIYEAKHSTAFSAENRVEALVIASRVKAFDKGIAITEVIDNLYSDHEADMLKWMAHPSTSIHSIYEFLTAIPEAEDFGKRPGFMQLRRLRKAGSQLSLIEQAKVFVIGNKPLASIADKRTLARFKSALPRQAESWCKKSTDIRDLATRIQNDLRDNNLTPNDFAEALSSAVVKHPDLIKTQDDALELFKHPYFWSESFDSSSDTTPLEKPLMELLKIKRKEFSENPVWRYDPIVSEKVHGMVKRRLIQNHCYPTDYDGLDRLWKAFTSRGVSTVTDDILGVLLKMGSPEQIEALEDYAVRQGRVFDQGLRDEFAIRQIKKSRQYNELILVATRRDLYRLNKIQNLINLAQELMSDLGIRYVEFLEDISVAIRSTYEEAELIHDAKAKNLLKKAGSIGSGASDSRLKMLYEILPYIKSWKASRQYDFLLYLRGSIPATPFIISQFPRFGPERIRKMYQGLPIEAAMAVVNLYLQETLLARKSVHQGYGKKLIRFLVKRGSVGEVESQANLLLEGLLYGVEKAKNKPFQKQVLSALIAMKPDEKASLGETIKVILEQFPGVGPKVGQFLVATGLLAPDVQEVVAETQDSTLPPKRFDLYKDLQNIVGKGHDIGIDLFDLLGSGSLKYSASGLDRKSGQEVALQIFREDVQNNSDLQIKVLNGLIEYVIRKGGQKWAFLQVIVDGAMNAVAREKEFDQEAAKTKLARTQLYPNFSDATFDVSVPVQALINKRLLVSRFAHGSSFRKLKKTEQQRVGIKILEMENEVLWSDTAGGITDGANDRFDYDTDRHPGNYLVDTSAEKTKISPIDFGQITSFTRAQRDKAVELFSYAAILVRLGSNDWIADRVAGMFQIKRAELGKLKRIMSEMFPMPHGSEIVAYFSLIAAINQSVSSSAKKQLNSDLTSGKLDFFYTDFIRAHIQLAGIERDITIPANVMTPRKNLFGRVQTLVSQHRAEMTLSTKQKTGIFAENARRRIKSFFTRKKYEPIVIRENPKLAPSSKTCETESIPETEA